MKSLGPLLRKLRGDTPLQEMAGRIGISNSYLANVEAGRRTLDEARAREFLGRGFGLTGEEIDALLLEVGLYDLGLKDSEFRQFVIDVVRGDIPQQLLNRVKTLYKNLYRK